MIVVVQGLNPSVASFNGETASIALGGEQFIPIGFTVGNTILQEEWSIAEQFAAVTASKAFRMEVFANGIQAITLKIPKKQGLIKYSKHTIKSKIYLNFTSTLAASRSQVLFKTIFTVKITLLLNEANVLQRTTAIAIGTVEVFGTPDLTQSGNEGTPL